ncbi:MAG: benzoyl-CoA reductase subunit D [bacterium]|nr:benzoyl-CoA reductase subunit D [bacterium]
MLVCGCDVGAGSVKLAVMDCDYQNGNSREELLFLHNERIRKRNPVDVVNDCFTQAGEKGFPLEDFQYIASTGEGDAVHQRTGHFYSMTCHARGARYFKSDAMSVIDMGALHMRAIKLDERGKVVKYKMTGQCASGTGQFLENISRYLGVSLSEVPELSLQSTAPQAPSGICAVLAETDVINLVSKGVPLPDIIRGIHDSVAKRAVKLLAAFKVESPLVLTGGLAMDAGLVQALQMQLEKSKYKMTAVTDPNAMSSGAIGAALWGAFRSKVKSH